MGEIELIANNWRGHMLAHFWKVFDVMKHCHACLGCGPEKAAKF